MRAGKIFERKAGFYTRGLMLWHKSIPSKQRIKEIEEGAKGENL
jgi:hypothetical protein